MPDDRTTVTELSTALGMLPQADIQTALMARPAELAVGETTWARLVALYEAGTMADEFATAYGNGRAFLEAADALRGRTPRLIEWTGGRRPPGDEVAPVDLRIDHVYLVSCKYLSRNIANPSPARLFEGLLATSGDWDQSDWYLRTAPEEYRALYRTCRSATGLDDLPDDPEALTPVERRGLRKALGRSYPAPAQEDYRALCARVSAVSAERWRENVVARRLQERQAWRLLRIGNATYFLLGADAKRSLRLRVASPWDWRQSFEFLDLDIRAGKAGQPQVDWSVLYRERAGARRTLSVDGHVEVRWSHGRFAQPPEAKIYLETATDEIPGYFALSAGPDQPRLWE